VTIPATSDALADTLWREIKQSTTGRDLVCCCAHDAERVPPLVPGDPRDHRLKRQVIELSQRRMARVNHHHLKLLNPDASSTVKLQAVAVGDRREPGGGQQIIDEHPEGLIDDPPLPSTDALKQLPMRAGQIAPRKLHQLIGALETPGDRSRDGQALLDCFQRPPSTADATGAVRCLPGRRICPHMVIGTKPEAFPPDRPERAP